MTSDAIRRVAEVGVDPHDVVKDPAGRGVGAKAPFAVVLTQPGVADAAEGQVGNGRLDRTVVDGRVPEARCSNEFLLGGGPSRLRGVQQSPCKPPGAVSGIVSRLRWILSEAESPLT